MAPARRDVFRRARLLIAYDGSTFHGFAINRGVDTVAGLLTEKISMITRRPVQLVGAGRTDAGVHAWGQVVSLDLAGDTDLANLQHRLNRILDPKIVVRAARWTTDPDFSARFSALWRHYRYDVLNTPTPHPFLAATSWHVAAPLNPVLMNLACDALIGERDFSSFGRRPPSVDGQRQPGMSRYVFVARWADLGAQQPGLLRFEIRANAFCHQMVRSIVGTLVDVGHGAVTAGEMTAILRAKDRRAAGQLAPPRGLCLWEVGYPPGEEW
jgi:tRNA pseudouridine38-40 synthase